MSNSKWFGCAWARAMGVWKSQNKEKIFFELLPSEKGDPSHIFVRFFEVEIMMDSSTHRIAEPKFER
jgi:hypothetical protein